MRYPLITLTVQKNDNVDGTNRVQAREVWHKIEQHKYPTPGRQNEDDMLEIIRDANKFITLLHRPRLKDIKQADGHSIVAEQRNDDFGDALVDPEARRSGKNKMLHCWFCQHAKGIPRRHQKQALAAVNQALEMRISCCG